MTWSLKQIHKQMFQYSLKGYRGLQRITETCFLIRTSPDTFTKSWSISIVGSFYSGYHQHAPSKEFFSLLKSEFSWTSINCFHGFLTPLTEKVLSPSLNELTRIVSNDDGVFNYFINMKDYIVKTTRSLRDEWNSRNTLYSLRKGSQVVYLFDCMKTREPWTTNCKGSSINSKKRNTDKGERFLRIEAVFENEFCNLQIYLPFFMLSNRIQN